MKKISIGSWVLIMIILMVLSNINITKEVKQSELLSSSESGFGLRLKLRNPDDNSKEVQLTVTNAKIAAQLYDGMPLVLKQTNISIFGGKIKSYDLVTHNIPNNKNSINNTTGTKEYWKVLGTIVYSDFSSNGEGLTYVDLTIRLEDKVEGITRIYFSTDLSKEQAQSHYMVGGLITLKKTVSRDSKGEIQMIGYEYLPGGYEGLEYEPPED